MNDVVSLRLESGVIVYATVEDKITRLHLFKLELDGKGVKLIGLVPSVQVESKFLSHVVGDLSSQGTAVQE